jgi:hypothetical protein
VAGKDKREGGLRHVREAKLWETTITAFPAMPGSMVTSVRSDEAILPMGPDLPYDETAANARIREWAGGNWEQYGRAFLWSDIQRSEGYGGHALQVADVIDDELVCNPMALRVVVAQLAGLGARIPDDDVPIVRSRVEALLAQIGETPPWAEDQEASPDAEPDTSTRADDVPTEPALTTPSADSMLAARRHRIIRATLLVETAILRMRGEHNG